MDAVSDALVHTVVAMTSAQVGKTEIVGNIVGFHIHHDPAPMLVLQPTLEMAMAWSKDRLAPMLRDTPALRGKVRDPRARDSGNTLLHKIFDGGHITIAGANSAAGLASRPIRIVLADEVDRYPLSAGTEGDPVSLARKRTTTFWNRKIVLTSTPTVRGESRIEDAFEESDKRRFWVPCPHCGHSQILKWSSVRWDDGDASAAHYVCDECGSLWTDAERWAAVRRGEWRSEKPFNGTAGFWISELYSPWVRLSDTVQAFLDAKPHPERLQTFINTSLAETWEERGEKLETHALDARREAYGPDSLPADVEFLTAGVDTQGDRLECEVVGWNRDERSWGVEYRVFAGDPAQDHVWAELDRYLLHPFPRPGGGAMRIQAVAIDSGGHHAESVYRFAATRVARRVWAIKGLSGAGRPIWPIRASKTATNDRVWMVGVDTAKDAVTARWGIEDGPGSTHIPADPRYGYDEEWVAQMTAEQRVTRYREGRPYKMWTLQKGRRNEAFDCRVYALAAMRSIYRGAAAKDAPRQAQPGGPPRSRGRGVRRKGIG